LKERAKTYGVRLSTLMANAPFGSSSIRSNSQPGIEPPRKLLAKKDGLPKLVPGYFEYKDNYTTTWSDEFNNIDYFKLTAVMQKFEDQTLSLNQYHDLNKYPDSKVPQSLLIEEMLVAQYYGNKSYYYYNIVSKKDSDKQDYEEEETEPSSCGTGGCKI